MKRFLALLALLIASVPANAQVTRGGYYLWHSSSYGTSPYVPGGYQVSSERLTATGETQFRQSILGQSGAAAMNRQGIPQEYQTIIRKAASECQIIYIPRPAEGVYFEQSVFSAQYDSQWRNCGNWCYCIVAGVMPRYAYFSTMIWSGLTLQPHVLSMFDMFYTQIIVVNKSGRKGIGYGAPERCMNWSIRSFPVFTSKEVIPQPYTVQVPVEVPVPVYEAPELPLMKRPQGYIHQESPGILCIVTKILPFLIFPEGDRYTFNVAGGKGGRGGNSYSNSNSESKAGIGPINVQQNQAQNQDESQAQNQGPGQQHPK
jgi:hypothetical protein